MGRETVDLQGSGIGRRRLLRGAGAAFGVGAVAALLPKRPLAAAGGVPLQRAMAESDLVYVTPLRADGDESRCQAEVWFVADAGDAVVVTASDAWRARAVRSGLDRARLWVGDEGVWTESDGAYLALPSTLAEASVVTDPAEHARLLEVFGAKYRLSWLMWGPRFRNGLADGSRVMIRYRPLPKAAA
ncbi:MAG: hypothetical protein RIC56_02600 [Pseudomonadales bacterium]